MFVSMVAVGTEVIVGTLTTLPPKRNYSKIKVLNKLKYYIYYKV